MPLAPGQRSGSLSIPRIASVFRQVRARTRACPTGTAPSRSACAVRGRCASSNRASFRSDPAAALVDRSWRANHAAAERDASNPHTPDSCTTLNIDNRSAVSNAIAVFSSDNRCTAC